MVKSFIKLSAVAAFAFAFVVAPVASAFTVPGTVWTEVPFTETELSTNWSADRTYPSGDVTSVSYGTRNDVAKLGIVSAEQSTLNAPGQTFYNTEGVKKNISAATSVKADLYVEGEWETDETNVRAGLWGVASDVAGSDATTDISAYPIVEYTNTEAYTGFRVYNVITGTWTNLPAVEVNVEGWNTVEIVLNEDGSFTYVINGDEVNTTPATGSVEIGSVILNSYNYGGENDDYFVHWSKFATGVQGQVESAITNKDQCKENKWKAYMNGNVQAFKNQGQCVAYVASSDKSKHHRETVTLNQTF